MPRVLGTLWARILIPFALVILTFVVTTVLVVAYMDDVGVEIRVIRTGYLTLALKSKDLARKQEDLREYVASDLVGETNTQRVRIRLESFRKIRTGLVTTVERVVQQLGNLPARHRRRLADTAARLVALQHAIDELDPAYATLATAPPIEATSPNAAPVEPAQAEAGRAALERVKLAEAEITKKATELAEYQERSVTSTARNLEYNANRLRWYTISLSATAVVVGLLVAVWVAIALRPLRRLRAGAQRVGAGDYGARIEETGPAEVSDLAREFNSMGRAIEQRERELVRSERLAAVGKMAAMIAHEVRNPLSAIALNTELMGDELSAEQPEARALCKAIQREVDRLTAITEEYLAFARLPRPKLAPEAVNQVVEQLAAFARATSWAAGRSGSSWRSIRRSRSSRSTPASCGSASSTWSATRARRWPGAPTGWSGSPPGPGPVGSSWRSATTARACRSTCWRTSSTRSSRPRSAAAASGFL
jgi:two-component system NtrC family sensor kinase